MQAQKLKNFDSSQKSNGNKISGIIEEKQNFLLNRKEVKVIVEAAKNPSYEEAEKIISEKFDTPLELVVIKAIKGKFGMNSFLISAFIYKSKEDKEQFEPKKKEKKEAEQKQEQTGQAQPKQEQAKEEEKITEEKSAILEKQ